MPSAFWILTPPSAGDARSLPSLLPEPVKSASSTRLGPPPGPAQISRRRRIWPEQAGSDRWGVRVEALGRLARSAADNCCGLLASVSARCRELVLAGLAGELLIDPSRLAALRCRCRELAEQRLSRSLSPDRRPKPPSVPASTACWSKGTRRPAGSAPIRRFCCCSNFTAG